MHRFSNYEESLILYWMTLVFGKNQARFTVEEGNDSLIKLILSFEDTFFRLVIISKQEACLLNWKNG